jgi:FeS assembly SUF system regulator
VSKILKLLNEAQLVTSVRGANGGYAMVKASQKISLAEVIAAIDGNIALTQCCQTGAHCIHHQHCQVRPRWQLINQALLQIFSQYTLADLLEKSHV